jgi:hypothetical protein
MPRASAVTEVEVESKRVPKDLRYRRQFFPDADKTVFDVSEKGFVPLPIILRKLIRHLSAPELRVLIYLELRASRYGICYPTYDEIVHELGLMGRKNLLPHLKSLEQKRFISTHTATGKTFFLIHDPRVAITHLLAGGGLTEQELFEINELYADLNQKQVGAPAAAQPAPPAEPGTHTEQDLA